MSEPAQLYKQGDKCPLNSDPRCDNSQMICDLCDEDCRLKYTITITKEA